MKKNLDRKSRVRLPDSQTPWGYTMWKRVRTRDFTRRLSVVTRELTRCEREVGGTWLSIMWEGGGRGAVIRGLTNIVSSSVKRQLSLIFSTLSSVLFLILWHLYSWFNCRPETALLCCSSSGQYRGCGCSSPSSPPSYLTQKGETHPWAGRTI